MRLRRDLHLAVAMILVAMPLLGQENRPSSSPAVSPGVLDHSLQPDGMLSGRVIDASSQPFAGLTVRLRAADGSVAESITDSSGRFRFVVRRGGIFTIEAAGAHRVHRLWTAQAAPPAARRGPLELTVTAAEPTVVRGQAPDPQGWLTPYRGSWIAMGALVGLVVIAVEDGDAS